MKTKSKIILNKISKFQYGFTILETIVALSIFSTSILGIIVISGRGITDLSLAKDRLTALYLAQEGIELARNMRDEYLISDSATSWQEFMAATLPCNGVNGCNINSTLNKEIVLCLNPDGCPLSINQTSGRFYSTGGGQAGSGFYRKIIMTPDGNKRVSVKVTVKWGKGQSVLTSELYNWK